MENICQNMSKILKDGHKFACISTEYKFVKCLIVV